ncbi:hypothetical protein ECZU23_14360 [Escherichia coli]|nr:hypothetical protein ECZU23_14360 [Escherichia coli]
MSLSRKPEVTWYGWDGDRLTTIQTQQSRIQTVYEPGSFTPLIRIETDNGEREKTQRHSPAEKLQQEGSEDGTAWCSRLNWYGCWTDWRKKSGQTA